MKIRRKSAPTKEFLNKEGKYGNFSPFSVQAYKYVWIGYFVVHIAAVIFGVFCRINYVFNNGEYPNRKDVTTFTQFKLINSFMLLWPLLLIAGTFLTVPKDEGGNPNTKFYKQAFKLNVAAQVGLIYAVYFSIFYATEIMKDIAGQEVISGHIFIGFLSSSSFLSTSIYIHHFRDRNTQVYRIFQIL